MDEGRSALGHRLIGAIFGVLAVQDDERGTLAALLLVFGLGEAGRGLGMNASDALFFVRFGVERLPWMYIGLGGLSFLAIVLYAAGLSRYRWRLLPALYLLIALALGLVRLLIPLGHPAIYPVLWLSVQVFAWVLLTAAWSLASQSFDTRQAKRLFPLLASASIAGSAIGNAITGPMADLVGTENLYLIYALLLMGAFLTVRRLASELSSRDVVRLGKRDPGSEFLAGFRALRSSRLMRLIAAASVLFSVLFFSVWFPFNKVVSQAFSEEAAVAGFLGNFTSIVMVSTLLLSLVSNRIYSRLGIVNVILVVPLIYMAGFGLWFSQFTLATAIAFRFLQLVWINGAAWTAWNALLNVYHSERREQLRAFVSGVPNQVGTSLSGVLLLLGERVLTTDQVFAMGGSAAVLLFLVCWGMRPAYGQALLRAIRDGLVDVFTGSPVLGRYRSDAQARASLVSSLSDANEKVRRVAADLLGRIAIPESIQQLAQALEDESASVREAAVRAVGSIGDDGSSALIEPLLSDAAPEVRVEAVRALASQAPRRDWLNAAGQDPDAAVRAEAAAGLYALGEGQSGQRIMIELLDSEDQDQIRAALRAAERHSLPIPIDRLRDQLHSNAADLRALAVLALRAHTQEEVQPDILARLQDHDQRVRSAAARVARSMKMPAPVLFGILESNDRPAQVAALSSLQLDGEADRQRLISWTSSQLKMLRDARDFAVRLQAESAGNDARDVRFVIDLLKRRQSEKTGVMLQALRKLAPEHAMRVIERGLESDDRELKSQALEALETLGDPAIVRGLLPLLEVRPSPAEVAGLDQVLRKLGQDQDPWLRAFSARIQAERLWSQFEELQARVSADTSHIVQQAWEEGIRMEGVHMGETLDTLTTMDRILYLREIPILDDLGPEDLHEIAEIAVERSVPEGGYLCREGELETELYLIVEGEVTVTKKANGREKELRRLGPGQPVGELAILAAQPRSATVRAINGSVRVLAIRGEEFQAVLRDRPAVSMAMLANLARRLGSMA